MESLGSLKIDLISNCHENVLWVRQKHLFRAYSIVKTWVPFELISKKDFFKTQIGGLELFINRYFIFLPQEAGVAGP